MQIANDVFRFTSLDQSTFRLKIPANEDEYTGAYTPRRIMSWQFADIKSADLDFMALDMFVHEACHVIELYIQGRKERLLKDDYGYASLKITPVGVRLEAWVRALQALISKDIFGVCLEPHQHIGLAETFTKLGAETTEAEFAQMVEECTQEIKQKDLSFYYGAWNKACQYVKENRK